MYLAYAIIIDGALINGFIALYMEEKMAKIEAAKKSCLQPVPKVLVSCRGNNGEENALAVAYCCNCSYDPPMLMVGIVPSRYSHKLIKESGCFVVNLVEKDYKENFEYLGSVSKRDEDKIATKNIKLSDGIKVNAPIMDDCPVNIECTIVDSIMTGSHEMFVGRIDYVHGKDELTDEEGSIDWSKVNLI